MSPQDCGQMMVQITWKYLNQKCLIYALVYDYVKPGGTDVGHNACALLFQIATKYGRRLTCAESAQLLHGHTGIPRAINNLKYSKLVSSLHKDLEWDLHRVKSGPRDAWSITCSINSINSYDFLLRLTFDVYVYCTYHMTVEGKYYLAAKFSLDTLKFCIYKQKSLDVMCLCLSSMLSMRNQY